MKSQVQFLYVSLLELNVSACHFTRLKTLKLMTRKVSSSAVYHYPHINYSLHLISCQL
jgi:hypothetical protein